MEREVYAKYRKYMLCPLSDEDREAYVRLAKQLKGESSLFLNPFAEEIMWASLFDEDTKVYAILDDHQEFCGSLELQNWKTRTPEIGIDLLEEKRNRGIGPIAIKMIC